MVRAAPATGGQRRLPAPACLLLISLLLGGASRPTAAAPPPATSRSLPPGDLSPAAPAASSNALLILDARDAPGLRRAIGGLEAVGVRALHVFPPRAVLAHVPRATRPLTGLPGVAAAFESTVPEQAVSTYGPEALLAARFWNQALAAPEVAAQDVEPAPPPPADDVRHAPRPLALAASGGSPGYYDTSAYLAGSVAVGIILPESTGAVDESTEDWSGERMDRVVAEIQAAMAQWAAIDPAGELSFYYDIHCQVPVPYEPVARPSYDDGLWIAEALAQLGYGAGLWYERAFAYLNALRNAYGTDWAVLTLVADSLNDPDGRFTDGYFAYTYGFLIVMTYDNDGWGIANMDSIMAHEFAHCFGAGDEYCQPGYACCWGGGLYGYVGVANGGCEAGCDHTGNGVCDGDDATPGSGCQGCAACAEVSCLMRQCSLSAGVCPATRAQLGMRDSDGDGILDPLDTTPTLTLDPWPPETVTATTFSLAGLAQDVPYPSPAGPGITINALTAVEYELDGDGAWQPAGAADGVFDGPVEGYALTTGALAEGEHRLRLRAQNDRGNAGELDYGFSVDSVAPVSSIQGQPLRGGPSLLGLELTWSGEDGGTGIAGYDVQYRVGPDGAWTGWLTGTVETSALFEGVGSATYCFRCRARDRAGNVEAWPPDPGDACVEVQMNSIWLPLALRNGFSAIPIMATRYPSCTSQLGGN